MSTVSELDRDATWAAIDAHRLDLAGLLDGLSEEDWRRPSLCTDWTVRDVAAHLTLQQVGLGDLLAMSGGMVRARGNLDRMVADAARRRAAKLTTGQTIAEIRAMVGSRRHNLGVTYRETLIDILVHSQDIAVALDRELPVPPPAAATALDRMWSMRWPPPFPATHIMKRYRLTATDTDWSAGEGPEVDAPIGALLLLGAGRLVALPHLSGPGAVDLTTRLSAR